MVPPPTSGEPSEATLPRDVVEDLVGEPRRRAVLRHLSDRGEPVALTDVAAAVGADEHQTSPDEVPRDVRTAIRDDIYQYHLPKLTATGVVEFDSMRGKLSLSDPTVVERLV